MFLQLPGTLSIRILSVSHPARTNDFNIHFLKKNTSIIKSLTLQRNNILCSFLFHLCAYKCAHDDLLNIKSNRHKHQLHTLF